MFGPTGYRKSLFYAPATVMMIHVENCLSHQSINNVI